MSMSDFRKPKLKEMVICRFCLDDMGPFTSIYEKDSRDGNPAIPLPLQLMACVAIEVFANDGMPQYICNPCRAQSIGAYNFKTACKKADDALKLFVATGNRTLLRPLNRNRFYGTAKERTAKENAVKKARLQSAMQAKHRTTTNLVSSASEKPITEILFEEVTDEGIIAQPDNVSGEAGGEEYTDEQEDVQDSLVTRSMQHQCSKCDQKFASQRIMAFHVQRFHTLRTRAMQCRAPNCMEKFYTVHDFEQHRLVHAQDGDEDGDGEGEKFPSPAEYRSRGGGSSNDEVSPPQQQDDPAWRFSCSYCSGMFLSREDYEAHTAGCRSEKRNNLIKCRHCPKHFHSKILLKRHELSHGARTGDSEKDIHQCSYCEASFKTSVKLTRHVTQHESMRPFRCRVCGCAFLLEHHLARHIRTFHSVSKSDGSYKCDQCSMSFQHKDSLINHSAIHSMVSLCCVICGTSFDTVKQVKSHIVTHLSGLPYSCDKCDYSFETEEQLREHALKHAEMEYEDKIEEELKNQNKTLTILNDGEVVLTAVKTQAKSEEDDEEYEDDLGGHNDNLDADMDSISMGIGSQDSAVTRYRIADDGSVSAVVTPPAVVRTRMSSETNIRMFDDKIRIPTQNPRVLKVQQSPQVEASSESSGDNDYDDEQEGVTNMELEADSADESLGPATHKAAKVYGRKSTPNKIKPLIVPSVAAPVASLSEINQDKGTLETLGLTQQDVNSLPTQKAVDMKVGDKTVRLKKLIMTKAEIDVMVREGKVEMRGNTIIWKKDGPRPGTAARVASVNRKSSADSVFTALTKSGNPNSSGGSSRDRDPPTTQRPTMQKTYVKRLLAKK